MAGRKRKPFKSLSSDLVIETEDKKKILLKNIQIRCPICHSAKIRSNGTQQRGKSRIQSYRCRNGNVSFVVVPKEGNNSQFIHQC